MRARIHRSPDHKAKRAAKTFLKTQRELDELLRQFSPVHHAGLLDRLKPHLSFTPKAAK